jgi:hypothetical protein
MSTTVKLNDTHRAAIRRTLISDKFHQREGRVKNLRATLALELYNDNFDAEQQTKMRELPRGWLPLVRSVQARIGTVDFGNELPGGTPLPVPYNYHAHGENTRCLKVYGAEHHFAGQLIEILEEERDIKTEKERLTGEINGVLYSVTTSNKLVTVWPEIRSVVENICRTITTANLPAPRVADLNKALGLTK